MPRSADVRCVGDAHSGDIRTAIIEAAAALLNDGGHRAVTTRAVAAAAGVQAPTIYRMFGDKDGLMAAVADQAMAVYAVDEAARAADAEGDPVAELRSAWHTHIAFGLANPDLYGLLLRPGQPNRSSATAAGIDVLTRRVTRVAAAGRLRVPVAQVVRMIHAAGTGVVLSLLADPPSKRGQTLSDATLDAVLVSVLTDRPAPASDDHVALVLAFATAVPHLPGLSDAERKLLDEWLHRISEHDG